MLGMMIIKYAIDIAFCVCGSSLATFFNSIILNAMLFWCNIMNAMHSNSL